MTMNTTVLLIQNEEDVLAKTKTNHFDSFFLLTKLMKYDIIVSKIYIY